ncbi:MAG: chemotaxis protein CheW [Sphingopyxis sp.]
MTGQLHLLARIGDNLVAMPAQQIEAVVRVPDTMPVPGAPDFVCGLVTIRSRILTLIDPALLVGERVAGERRAKFMATMNVGGHGYALLLDDVSDVIALPEPEQMPVPMQDGWATLEPMLIDFRGALVLLVDPARLIGMTFDPLAAAA